MFLMGVGEQLSADLLRQLAPEEIRRITDEIAAMDSVAPDHMLSVFREFEGLAASCRFFAKGGADCARRLVEQAFGAESARKLLEPPPSPAASQTEAQVLQNADPQQLAIFLRDENPQTIALVLSNMPAESAGNLMACLPSEVQPQVALRMATLDRISPEVFRRITEAIGSKLKAIRQVTRSDGIRSLAALLNRVDGEMAETILTKVEEENQTVGASIRDLMFVFDDIASIDKEGMTALLAKVDRKVLTTALKGTTGKIREHFTQCMSQRAAEMLTEDMDALGAVRLRDVDAAQQQVVGAIRELQKQGIISAGRGGNDDYVV
jgi:flagellar motor switch protein FliG